MEGIVKKNGFVYCAGKQVWDKGAALQWIRRRLKENAVALYAGDDATDESAFRQLKSGGVGVRIGLSPKSRARYFLFGQRDVEWLLGRLCRL